MWRKGNIKNCMKNFKEIISRGKGMKKVTVMKFDGNILNLKVQPGLYLESPNINWPRVKK